MIKRSSPMEHFQRLMRDSSVANVKDGYELVNGGGLLTENDITDTNHVYEDLTEILPEGSVFTRMRKIVVDDVVAANDLLPKSDARRLESSDVTFQSWQHVAGDKFGKLNTVVQKNVQNDGARKLLQDIYQRRGLSIDSGKGDFAMDPNDFDREEDFLSLLGTDSGRPTTYMLKDYHSALGDKKLPKS
ncbi:8e260b2e-01d5-477d-bf70-82d47ee5eece-CDS [Sclerotinia trifoliorum]|uniref:8e260b2e-01d5-477d-bf70-82d47ee5eece-CDS n=1 Tax=Sclerotinia trifoliorum TaxID=28548 RepID=A0A8H2VQS9_9HELO|nr:8e260b2e-01d5-477d-bf70-82d47ee5eece-CDS [Sclerotinia trifoliorum]